MPQNSAGPLLGDNGFLYFPREVVNREFAKWGSALKILKPMTAQQIALAKEESTAGYIQRLIIQAWYLLSDRFGAFGHFPRAFLRGMRSLTELSRSLLRALGIINSLRMNDENRIKLYEAARSFIGTDASPNDLAPDELGCAETVNESFERLWASTCTATTVSRRTGCIKRFASLKTSKRSLSPFLDLS